MPEVGQTLTTSDGEWSNDPTSFSYRWVRNANAIAGETANTYTLVDDDVGATIFSIVTATNAAGDGHAASDATDPVLPAP